MTEEEARTKWCPFSRVVATFPVEARFGAQMPDVMSTAVNRGGDGAHDEVQCFASGCMAWRWVSSASMDNPRRTPGAGVQTIKREHGYCGLAGHQ